MRSIVIILAICFSIHGTAQFSFGVHTEVGLNRIGVLYELGGSCQLKNHSFILGARFYEPDLVFEKNFPGMHLGYNYTLRADSKMKLVLGASLSGFYENKVTTNLWVFDPKLVLGPQWALSENFQLNLTAGFGAVINKVETSYTSKIETFKYLNYELALGLTYYFGNNSNQ
jgi:hypothetical protein